MISCNIQVNMWLRATTSLWFSGQFELYPTNISASNEASEFCWQNALISLYNIWGYVLSRGICDWEPPQNNRPSQDQEKTNQVSEENISLIISSQSEKNQKLLFLFLQFAKTHNKILTYFKRLQFAKQMSLTMLPPPPPIPEVAKVQAQ